MSEGGDNSGIGYVCWACGLATVVFDFHDCPKFRSQDDEARKATHE